MWQLVVVIMIIMIIIMIIIVIVIVYYYYYIPLFYLAVSTCFNHFFIRRMILAVNHGGLGRYQAPAAPAASGDSQVP